VVIIAGETSGDFHGARLVKAMQDQLGGIFFCGMGGPALKAAGVRILVDASELSVVGVTEVFTRLPSVIQGLATLKRLLKSLKPDLVILIDFPDFNFRVAAAAKKLEIPVLYYISPQFWAWRPGRVKRIGKLIDHIAVILPFEEDFYKKYDVPVTYVGHPLLDTHLPHPEEMLKKQPDNRLVIGLLPGSREIEIMRHTTTMLDAAVILKQKFKSANFLISHAPSINRRQLESYTSRYSGRLDCEIISESVEKIFQKSDIVIVASGTVTLQAAIHGVPMVIIYKVSPLSFWLGRALVRVKHIGLVNLVAGRSLVPELVQTDAKPDKIAAAVSELLGDRQRLNTIRRELIDIRDLLGGEGASKRVAELALRMI
jgi:lipid-A-disaccharide synthase